MALTPVIVDSNIASVVSADTIVLTLPATRKVSELILLMVASNDIGAFSPFEDVAGYVKLINAGDGTSDCKIAVYHRAVDGTEADTIDVTTGGNIDEILGWAITVKNVDLDDPIFVKGTEAVVVGPSDRVVDAVAAPPPAMALAYLAHDGGDGTPPRHSVAGEGWNKFSELIAGVPGSGVSAVIATRNGSTDCTIGVPADDSTVHIQFSLRGAGFGVVDGSLKAGGGSRVYVPFPQTVF